MISVAVMCWDALVVAMDLADGFIYWKYSEGIVVNAKIWDRRWIFKYLVFFYLSVLFSKSNKQYGMRTLDNKIGVLDHISEEDRNSVSTEGNVGYSLFF